MADPNPRLALHSVTLALLGVLAALGATARAGTILQAGDIVVATQFSETGSPIETRVERIDPVTGARTTIGSLSDKNELLADVDVDALGRVYALGAVTIYRFQPQTYDAGDPTHNREVVSTGGQLFSMNGFDLGFDGLLYVA